MRMNILTIYLLFRSVPGFKGLTISVPFLFCSVPGFRVSCSGSGSGSVPSFRDYLFETFHLDHELLLIDETVQHQVCLKLDSHLEKFCGEPEKIPWAS